MTRAKLPPLSTLMPFEAAARLGSLSAAARELGVTQPAISRQIGRLEAWFGVALFDRSPRGLTLTPQGEIFRGAVASSFLEFAGAAERLRPPDADRTVTIAAHPGFAQLWLAPRLAGLQEMLPNLFFRLETTDREEDFVAGDHDLAIRFGTGLWPECRSTALLPERILPVCAPSYPAADKRLAPADLLAERLLHMDEVSTRWLTWRGWFAGHGIDARLDRPKLLYASYPLLLQAALAGEGVALGWLGLVDEALDGGRLVALTAPLERPSHGYFLCWREGRLGTAVRRRTIERVRDWFLDEAGVPQA